MKHTTPLYLATILTGLAQPLFAANPIIQTKFTADPAPLVADGKVYLYTSHDENYAPAGMAGFRMKDWQCYSSTDMVNWTDHGTLATLAVFPWAVQTNDAWAPQVIERNGKFYLYAPVSVPGWPKNVIGVAVADNPLGPFKDALGHPLVGPEIGFIDPSVFIDEDGQAYLYWGNPQLWYVKLNEDMISYSGDIIEDASIAKVEGQPDPYHYQEGPWVYKRNGHYYCAYATTCCPEGIGYAMSDSPEGPWEFQNYIMRPDGRSSGNHPGIIDYRGHSYVFGFNYKINFSITKEHHERRSICVSQFEYNEDGTIPELPWWEEAEQVDQLEYLNPFDRTEAETICWSHDIESDLDPQNGMFIHPKQDGAYIQIKGVDFGEGGAKTFAACLQYSEKTVSGQIELHVGSLDGEIIGSLPLRATDTWLTETASVNVPRGVHDLFLVFKGDAIDQLKMDYWQFSSNSK